MNSTECGNALEREVIVGNRMGLHSRPAAVIARMLSTRNCNATLKRSDNSGESADCRSVLSLLILAAGCGTKLTLRVSGTDAASVVEELGGFFDRNFDEED
ncbi:MAG: HPr family phosphocarrier protein [Lentisphaeria bacterium]|nr:HPr family phosphocarrier protein [Lentisphaeria bacterium]